MDDLFLGNKRMKPKLHLSHQSFCGIRDIARRTAAAHNLDWNTIEDEILLAQNFGEIIDVLSKHFDIR